MKHVCVIESIPNALRVSCFGRQLTHHVIPCIAGQEVSVAKQLSLLVSSGRYRVVALTPRMACFMRMFHLPSQDPAELLGIVQLQFARTTPNKSSDIVVDVKVLEQESKNQSLVAGAMMVKDQLTPFVDILNRAGLHPDVMTVNTQRLVPLARVVWLEPLNGEGKVLGVYLEGALVLGFFVKGEMVFSREEKVSVDWEVALRTFLDYGHQEFPGTSVKEIRLLGDREETGMARTFAGVTVNVQELSLMVRTAQERTAFELSPVAYLDLLLAMDEKSKVFDLSIDTIRIRREQKRKRVLWTHIGVIAGLFLAGLILLGWSKAYQEIRVSNALHEAVEKSSARVKDLEQKSRTLSSLEAHLSTPATTALLAELSKALPLDVRLTQVEMNNGKLSIKGEADTLESVRTFQTTLGSLMDFHDVRLEGIDKRPTEAAQMVMFRMNMKVEK